MAKRPRKQRLGALDTDIPTRAGDAGGGGWAADDTSRKVWTWWQQGRFHLKDWHADASENYEFIAGRQWEEDAIESLKAQQRPIITFNRTHPTIAAVSGYEINNRQEVTFLPRDPETNSKEANVDTAAVKYFRQECDAEDQESAQFSDTLVTGYGWTEHRMDYDEDPDGLLKVERVDPFEMVYDPSSRSANLTDRGWDIRGKWWDKNKAKDNWPDHDFDQPVPTTYDNEDLDGQAPIDRLAAAYYAAPGVGEHAQERKDKVFILEATWFEQEPFYTVLNPTTGQKEDLEPSTHKKLQNRLAEVGISPARSVKRTRKRFKRAFVHARDTLEEGDAPCPNNFHYQCITGHRDRNKNTWFGMVTAMKDPQRWANKWLSQFLHMLNTNVKNGIFYEKGTFERPGEVEQKVARPGFFQEVAAGYLDKFRKDESTQIPNDAMELMQYAVSSIRDVTGVNIELLGAQSDNETAAVEAHRKQSALTILAPLFASQRQYRKIVGRLELYFVREYLSDGRWIRIAGSMANPQLVQLARTDSSAKYDVIVDQSPLSTNVKQATTAVLATILPVLLKAGVPIPPDVLDYIDGLPSQLADKWKQLLTQKMSQPQQDPKTQLAQAKLQQDAKDSANQDQIDRARLAFDQQQAQVEAVENQQDIQMRQRELQLKEHELGVHSDEHLATLAHELVTAHQQRGHEAQQAALDRSHEAIQGSLDRSHQADQGAQDRDNAIKAIKAKPKPKPVTRN